MTDQPVGASPHINFTPDNQPAPIETPAEAPMERVRAAIAALNAAVGADIHTRLHAQHNALTAIVAALEGHAAVLGS